MSNFRSVYLLAVVATTAIAACGEDLPCPGTPAGGAATAPAAEAPDAAAKAVDPAPAASTVDTGTPTPAPASPADAGAPPAASAAPTKGTGGNIVGTVTTTPPKMAHFVVVYLENGPPANNDKPPAATIDQRKMTFSPFLTAIPVGGKVMFRNSDPFPHNAFSPDHERFDLGTMPQGGVRVHVFKSPGAYSILCNVHPNMLAYIDVVPSSYYALTDKDGRYTIKNVPAGTYQLGAWGPKLAPVSQSVTVASGDVTANLELHRGR